MWRRGLLAATAVALASAGCGDDGNGDTAAVTGGECRDASKMLAGSLESSLAARGDGRLRRLRTVKIQEGPDAPLTLLKKGAHVASGTLIASGKDNRTVSWVVSDSLLTTGGGVAFGLDDATRNATDLGSAAKPGSPIRDYADAIRESAVYERSRACVQDASNPAPEAQPKSSAKPNREVSRAKFVKKLNRVCRSATARLEKIDDASFTSRKPAVVARAFEASVKQYDSVLARLEKLAVPKADRSTFDEYVASIKRSRGVAARIADKLRAGEKPAHLVKVLTDEKNERLSTALVLGADDCG